MNNQGKQIWLQRMQQALNATMLLFALALCFPVTVNWTVLCLALAAWISVLCLRSACGGSRHLLPPLAMPLLGLAAAAFISGLFNGGVGEAFKSVFSFRPLIVYFCAYEAFSANEKLKSLALSLLLTLSAVAGYWATIQQVCNIHPGGFQWLQGTGFLSAPMAFAGQMQLFSLVALAIAVTGARRELLAPNRNFFIAILMGNVLGLVFAAERSAWLGFAMGAPLIVLLASWRLALKAAGAGAVALAGAWFAVPVIQKRMLPLLDWQHDVSTQARLVVWRRAWSEFQRSPIYGVGINKFPHVVIPEALVPGQAKYLAHAHSNYLHMLATMGVIGLAAYLWLLVASIWLAWQQFWHERSQASLTFAMRGCSLNAALALGLLGSLVSLAVAGIFEYNFGTSQVRLAEWFLLGMLTYRHSRR